MNRKAGRLIIDIILFIILIACDLMTKHWAAGSLMDKPAIELIPHVLELRYLPNGNTGAAFGILSGHRILFLVIAVIVVTVIVYLLINFPENKKYRIIEYLLVFIAAGGVGNMIDRIVNNYVIDFIYISCINFPIFNVADMYVSICTVILAVIILFRFREEDYGIFDEAFSKPISRLFNRKNSK